MTAVNVASFAFGFLLVAVPCYLIFSAVKHV